MSGKVSMVMPCYNKADYIGEMLDSIIAQDWDNIELILVNDGSTDGTRDIIGERGYNLRVRFDLIVIDQDNQGVAQAVKNGLERVTGDYVCIIDCDDVLHPDYVSTMTGYLEDHPEHDWCICDFDYYLEQQEITLGSDEHTDDRIDVAGVTLEDFVMGSYCRGIWRFFVRTSYFKRCRIRENIPKSDQKITHEAYIAMPLLAGGSFGHVEKALYKYRVEILAITNIDNIEKRIYYEDVYLDAIRYVLGWLDVPSSVKARVISLAELKHDYEIMTSSVFRSKDDCIKYDAIKNLTERINCFYSHQMLDPDKLFQLFVEKKFPPHSLWIAFENAIRRGKRLSKEIVKLEGKRVIGSGAKGKVAASYVPMLMGTVLEPSVLWDKTAMPDDVLCGIHITQPDLTMLSNDDVLLVFPANWNAKREITGELRQKNIRCKVYLSFEITRLLAEQCFPQLYQ